MNKSKAVKLASVVLILILFIAACSSNNSVVNNNDISDGNNSDNDNSGNAAEDNNANVDDMENTEEGNAEGEDTEGEETDEIQLLGYEKARDFLAQYFLREYGIKQVDPWMEHDLTPEGLVGSSTIRFVSGPLTIKMSAPVVAPENLVYTIEEASYIVNGFYWEGTLNYFGEITETQVLLPGTVLDAASARDAVLDHLDATYGISEFGEWEDEGLSSTGSATNLQMYSSGSWMVEIEFAPSAPLVATYHVTFADTSAETLWEGDITLHGEITVISHTE